ncbi:laminin subunit gamma-2 [Mugil cephalus]|uniref:laminin subunit gamma-2 n=1 Tax=Mugil cephalus TaxID=48193 RepID=UPI001FB62B70|nr:laminin subunit gamma-2 [Mugil cephalus]
MRSFCWISLCGLLTALCGVQATYYTYYSTLRCDCNGRSRYCLRDSLGLHCLDCQGNTEGRHCERCKDGFFLEGAGPSCTPCRCNPTGSVRPSCDSRGRCTCKDGVSGDKCDRCPEGPIGPNGCPSSRQTREDSGSLSTPCFCYGHSSQCSAQSGFSIHNITSTFTHGNDGWKVATARGVAPDHVNFRWSPKHQDLEVISRNSLPVYLYAPDSFLGNQLLSYGRIFSFSLRLDRGVRHPSTSDVVLEGGGLSVSSSLGDLRSIVPCGQKIRYSFRLDERPGVWRPHLSSFQFQTLLQNLSAIKIRATFGESGRGYLDNVVLTSARRGDGVPACWVQTCVCPRGHEGQFCERCSAGFRRSVPADGAFASCVPCSCRGGSCDPQTGDCYSSDDTQGQRTCTEGFYSDPRRPDTCVRCPCPQGVSCSLDAGSLEPRCERCPPGSSGLLCDVCQEGFYSDPSGGCRPCQCNGHIDVSVAGSCDATSGKCLKCLNNTKGWSCEDCVRGFYHSRATDACKSCSCDLQGSESEQCDDAGQCRCRPGFEGLRCQRSNCPACFSPIKAKMDLFSAKLKELESLFSDMDGGLTPANGAEMEVALRAMEDLVDNLQDNTKQLTELEVELQRRLSSISSSQLEHDQDIQIIADTTTNIKQQQQMYKTKVAEVQGLMEEMKFKLQDAKTKLQSAEVPVGDAPQGSDDFSSLVKTATSLADEHKTDSDAVQQTANEALADSKESLTLIRSLMNRENKVKELIGDLKNMYDQASAEVKTMEKQATRLSDEARDESKMSNSLLTEIAAMERNLPSSLEEEMDNMVSRLALVKKAADKDISDFKDLQDGMQQEKLDTEDKLAKGKAAQQVYDKLVDRVNAAKDDTEDALNRIKGNINGLEDTLSTLKDFDQRISNSEALAKAANEGLPRINATIQQAVSNNEATNSALGDVSKDFDSALETIGNLEGLVNTLEGTFASLPPHSGLVKQANRLNGESLALKTKADTMNQDLAAEVEDANNLAAEAKEVSDGAAAAFDNARNTGNAVRQTLRKINNMLANMNQSSIDETQLKRLEDSLARSQGEVEGLLRPRLRDMEEQEAAHRRQLDQINLDIDTILADIANLEDILEVVPKNKCFNTQVEKA